MTTPRPLRVGDLVRVVRPNASPFIGRVRYIELGYHVCVAWALGERLWTTLEFVERIEKAEEKI